ncbi:MAG: SDR family NAD(P)-dependent oxidoreductase [Bacteroidota bacterium]|nr:SDR family NAD(P)-dependent oxidoreductase [Bacteroidota bacterium]
MGRTILITGASTGIGAETARRLAPDSTLLLHHNRSSIDDVASEAAERGAQVHTFQADLSAESGCLGLVAEVSNCTDQLDVLVNNAGSLLERHTVATLRWDLMEQIFALNTFAPMLLTRLCGPLLRKGTSPCIINITSIAMRHGAPTATIYGAAKGALDAFTRGSARELAPDIRVNAVAPGVILTPFHERYTTQAQLDSIKSQTPLGFHGSSEDIAHAVEFLIENPFTTGETLDINGGQFMR